ncbi:hypothetical protein LA59_02140 [Vibrio harveyi]|nr:hypothetical protein LA59_02140 [Vibrio harveyi]EGR1690258.1 hypothetical protein [Vibrio parahaemolyticus]KIT46949.1 hypothetical protein H337_05690 [Vibrio parahaemolyticus EN9701121]EGR3031347.1 hypothetical protein [Vibrio parahaemolyticus]EGW0145026.1 hypothetical protein [Vibrio parahaemolyticus]
MSNANNDANQIENLVIVLSNLTPDKQTTAISIIPQFNIIEPLFAYPSLPPNKLLNVGKNSANTTEKSTNFLRETNIDAINLKLINFN